jgi:hypothetical protein
VANGRWGAITPWIIVASFIVRCEHGQADPAPTPASTGSSPAPWEARCAPLRRGFVCPVDGISTSSARSRTDQIYQTKIPRLIRRDAAALFEERHMPPSISPGLPRSPHMPAGGAAPNDHVPGSLFSVNPATAQGVPACCAQRARGVC